MMLNSLPIISLDWSPPLGNIIDEKLLSKQINQQKKIQEVQKDAAAILAAARRQTEKLIKQAKQEKNKEIAKIKTSEQDYCQGLMERCETDWVSKHVKWVVDTELWQRHLIEQTAVRIHDCIEIVLRAWCEEQRQDEVLFSRLSKQVKQFANKKGITLYVHPDYLDKAIDYFSDELTVIASESLELHQGILQSPLLSLDLSLDRHFNQLIDWIRGIEKHGE